MATTLDISKLDRATILAALHNHALQIWHDRHTEGKKVFSDISTEEAREILEHQYQFSSLYGTEMGVDFHCNFVNTWVYDQIYGFGTGERVIAKLSV